MKALSTLLTISYLSLTLGTLHAATLTGAFSVDTITGNAGNLQSIGGQITVGDTFSFQVSYNGSFTDLNASTTIGTFGNGAIQGGGTLMRLSGTGWNPDSASLFGGTVASTNDTGGHDTAGFAIGSSNMPTVLGIPFESFRIQFDSTNLTSIIDTGAGQTLDNQLGFAFGSMSSLTNSRVTIHFTNSVSDNLWVYGGAVPTPEPGTATLLVGGTLLIAIRRFRRSPQPA